MVSKAKNAIEGFFAMLFCGMAAITLSPSSNYMSLVPPRGTSITKEGWQLTGNAMWEAVNKAGSNIGRKG